MKKVFLPHYSNIRVVLDAEKALDDNRRRSLWLGVSQGVLNLPRMIVAGLFRSAVSLASFIVALGGIFLFEVIIHPFTTFWVSLNLGRAGLLVDADDERIDEDDKGYMAMFDRAAFENVSIVVKRFDDGEEEIEANE